MDRTSSIGLGSLATNTVNSDHNKSPRMAKKIVNPEQAQGSLLQALKYVQ